MNGGSNGSVLLIGGSGVVGVRAARALRILQPELPIVIAGRDGQKADRAANEIGGPTTSLAVDLRRDDLGLPRGSSFGAMAVFVKDSGLVMSAGESCGAQLPLLSIAHERFCLAAEAGLGLRDDSRVIETWT